MHQNLVASNTDLKFLAQNQLLDDQSLRFHVEHYSMKNDAVFSKCKKYRYALWRTWEPSKPYAMFIGLNPTEADAINNNPTINRCIGFAKSWGYGGLCLTNLFAYLSTQPAGLRAAKDPIGPDNDQWLEMIAKNAGIIIAAWGNDGSLFQRSQIIATSISRLHCLKINKSGEPAHPLYQPSSAEPIPFVYSPQNSQMNSKSKFALFKKDHCKR